MKKERSKELFSPESCSPVLSGGIRDFTVHGTEPVPLHIYHQDYAHGGLSVPFHWHKELEWIWVEKGTLTLTLKTETRTISEGTFFSSTVTNCISSAALELPLRFTMPLYFFQKFSHVPIWIPVKQTGFVRCSLINCFFRLFHWKSFLLLKPPLRHRKHLY
mgnify:CR=1 FL=1